MQHLIKKSVMALGISMAASSVSMAETWNVKITNLTHGNHFTPLLVTAHDHDTHLFKLGEAASLAMEHMAECGHLAALQGITVAADTVTNPASGPLAPGANTTATLTDPAGSHLSVVAMILPTNDGFIGLNSKHIPAFDSATGANNTHVFWVDGYDAGTEKNDEVLNVSGTACTYTETGMMPAAPGGDAGTNGTGVEIADTDEGGEAHTGQTGVVHVHRGVLGDDDATGGKSDLNNTIHRWQNPMAKIVVTVTQ